MMKTDFWIQEHNERDLLDDYRVGIGRNSWYLKIPLVGCRSLFLEDYGYQLHAYACKCGEERVFISDKSISQMRYICSNCKNSGFLDVARLDSYGDFLVNIDISAAYTIEKNDAVAKIFISVPKSVDLARGDSIVYEKKKIFEIKKSLSYIDKTTYSGTKKVSRDVLKTVENELVDYIGEYYLKETLCDYSTLRMQQRSFSEFREVISWFMKYPKLKYSEFFLWVMDDDLYHNGGVEKTPIHFLDYLRNHKTQKSIKKALFKRYQHELSTGKFYPITPYIICRVFTDPNHIVRMLDHYHFAFTRYSDYQSLSLWAASHMKLIDFLKESYSEKQIVQMFENTNGDPSYWEDSVQMFNNRFDVEQISENFEHPRANVREIHDELIRCRYLVEKCYKTVAFKYDKVQLKPCGAWQNFQIVLPQTSDDLYLWAKQLHNCLYGYIDLIYDHKTTIYGVKESNVLMYAIEIRNGSLVQMKGGYNAEPNRDVKKSLNEWYQYYFANKYNKSNMEGIGE